MISQEHPLSVIGASAAMHRVALPCMLCVVKSGSPPLSTSTSWRASSRVRAKSVAAPLICFMVSRTNFWTILSASNERSTSCLQRSRTIPETSMSLTPRRRSLHVAAMLLDCCGASVPELTANRDAESEAILSGMPSFFIASHTAPFFLERFKRKSMEPGRRCLAAVLAMLSLRIARTPPWSSASSDASTLLFSVSATKMSSAEDLRSDLPVRRAPSTPASPAESTWSATNKMASRMAALADSFPSFPKKSKSVLAIPLK
mmetsp:Transcript_2913/g.10718  ORF Transcript_2913/g.10718 Transcript_2913/m.10718 type:complete len:260 (-) Transcript_2913:617-1396(-)